MVLADLPRAIQEHILAQVNDEYTYSNNSFNLTELLYCLRKAYFSRTQKKPLGLESAWFIYRGSMLDEAWTPLFRRNQVRCTYRLKNAPAVIVGKYDFLDGENSDTIYDLKTTKSLHFINEAKEEHIKQVRFYAWLNAIPKARLLYVDFGDVKAFDVEVGDCSDLLYELDGKATKLYWALQKGKPPEDSGPKWMCKEGVCEYYEECQK